MCAYILQQLKYEYTSYKIASNVVPVKNNVHHVHQSDGFISSHVINKLNMIYERMNGADQLCLGSIVVLRDVFDDGVGVFQ